MRWFVLKILHPILILASAALPSKKEAFQAVIIKLNNRILERAGLHPDKLLLLLPHCLQVDTCDIRITNNVRNCKGCGKCRMKGLIEISDKYNLDLHVATGGNLARRIVMDVRPDLILAIACERDLCSGIADVYPMPVYGVTNERPHGPCVNTTVSLQKIEDAISLLLAP
jgi:hypothetical protein